MRVQQRGAQTMTRRVLGDGRALLEPDAVLGTGSTRVTALHVPMTETGVEAQPNGAAVARIDERLHQARGPKVGYNTVVTDDVQGVAKPRPNVSTPSSMVGRARHLANKLKLNSIC